MQCLKDVSCVMGYFHEVSHTLFFYCQIMWMLVFQNLFWDPADLIRSKFAKLWDPGDLRIWFLSLDPGDPGSWCFISLRDPGDLGSWGSWILMFHFIAGSRRSWILNVWCVAGSLGSCILNFCFSAGSWRSWILTRQFLREILEILDLG